MSIEFRPARGHIHMQESKHAMDEVVCKDVSSVHAELMGDRSLWIGVYMADGSRVSIRVNVVSRKCIADGDGYRKGTRKLMLEMMAEQDEPAGRKL